MTLKKKAIIFSWKKTIKNIFKTFIVGVLFNFGIHLCTNNYYSRTTITPTLAQITELALPKLEDFMSIFLTDFFVNNLFK